MPNMNAIATIAPASPQYMRALERANKVRLARAELKRRVAMGEIHVAEVILDCPWEAQSMAVADLLMSQSRWGQTRCRRFLSQIPMSEKKTIGSMTERQRRTLAPMLDSGERGRAPSRLVGPLLVAVTHAGDHSPRSVPGSPRSNWAGATY
jgi:hypothetical protein